jgi:hypothetical protein
MCTWYDLFHIYTIQACIFIKIHFVSCLPSWMFTFVCYACAVTTIRKQIALFCRTLKDFGTRGRNYQTCYIFSISGTNDKSLCKKKPWRKTRLWQYHTPKPSFECIVKQSLDLTWYQELFRTRSMSSTSAPIQQIKNRCFNWISCL